MSSTCYYKLLSQERERDKGTHKQREQKIVRRCVLIIKLLILYYNCIFIDFFKCHILSQYFDEVSGIVAMPSN